MLNRTEQNRQALRHAEALIVATHVIANDSEAICSVNGKHKGRCFRASNLFKRLLRNVKLPQMPSSRTRSDAEEKIQQIACHAEASSTTKVGCVPRTDLNDNFGCSASRAEHSPLTLFSNVRRALLKLKTSLSLHTSLRYGDRLTSLGSSAVRFVTGRGGLSQHTSLRVIGLMVLKTRGCAKQSKNVFSPCTSRHSPSFAFTLSEVVITLGIIGVVAAISIPALLNNIQDAQYKTAYKKAYSMLYQAIQKANEQNNLIFASNLSSPPTDIDKNFLAIMEQFNVSKQCTNNNNNECWSANGEKYGLAWCTGYPIWTSYAFVDSSGMAWSQYWRGETDMFVDTNGSKKPNQWGKDRFAFFVYTETNSRTSGIPIKVRPMPDNVSSVCTGNICETQGNYYGTSWLYK